MRRVRRDYPIVRSVPRFVTTATGYAESSGSSGGATRCSGRRGSGGVPGQDRVRPADLDGRLVLDAGCGSGRYAAVAAGLGAQVAAVDVTAAVERAREVCAGLPGSRSSRRTSSGCRSRPGRSSGLLDRRAPSHGGHATAFELWSGCSSPGAASRSGCTGGTRAAGAVNAALRALARRLSDRSLHRLAVAGAVGGGIPWCVARTLGALLLSPRLAHPGLRHVRLVRAALPASPHGRRDGGLVPRPGIRGRPTAPRLSAPRPPIRLGPRRGFLPGSGVSVVGRRPA